MYFTTDTSELFIDTGTSSYDTTNLRTMINGLPFIKGTNCGEQGSWVAEYPGLQLRDGLSFLYSPNIDGSDQVIHDFFINDNRITINFTSLNLNNFGWKRCYCKNGEELTTQFTSEDILLFVYDTTKNNNNGGWVVIGNYNGDARTLQGHGIDEVIYQETSTNLPTSQAVVGYIKSLSYDGDYEI